jgi:uncharacterized membrane protein
VTAAALRQRCNVASSWAMYVCRRLKPQGIQPRHTQHCVALEFAPSSLLVYVGLEIKRFRVVPVPGRLTAPGLTSVVRV